MLPGCKKEADAPQWDIEVLGPVLKATIGIHQLFADSLTTIDPDGSVRIIYEGQQDLLATDSVYTIPDTSIATIYTWPFFPLTIQPNTPFYTNNKNLVLNVRGAELTRAIIQEGTIRVSAKNTLPTRVYFTYSVPEARKNGQSLSISRSVAAGSAAAPSYFSEDIDFAGYTLNLTGALNNTVNTIAYNVVARSDSAGPSFNVMQGDTMVNLTTTLIGLSPSYVRGYLGQKLFEESNTTSNNIGSIFETGQLLLDSASLSLNIENSIGADMQAYLTGLRSMNTRTSTTIPLVAPGVLSRNINISRAAESSDPNHPLRPSNTILRLDNSNSNLPAFLQNLPDRIESDLRLQLNPLGNVSGSNDFVYSDKLVATSTRLEIPLRLSMNSLVLRDTQALSIENLTNLDPVGPITFTLVAENGFPINLQLQLYTLNENYNVTDSLLLPGSIAAGSTDANRVVTSPTITKISIPISADRKSNILNARYMAIYGKVSTVGQPTLLELYESYALKLKLVADGTYSIR